ncbi:uncharacterized protein MKZ38_008259 [Zalerion maritima]|uniref:nitric oxide dioxygenase n=1 Tax=Zalerion maritima TaxID=339359 RepID=A0AAD5WW72_9PEZI|nr:uncharacterized protein MKZ38_008259 [Zalerion maritima]
MAAPVTASQIEIVKATAPVLKEHGTTITTTFYDNMLEAHPDLKNIFSMTSQANGRQPRALAQSVLAYATHIDDLPALTHAVERIAQKHASLFVTPPQYDIVGKHLMGAIGQVLGPAATPEIVDAWTAAYAALAQVFIRREAQMYEENGSWRGWRRFRIARKVAESENIASLYLEPVDGAKLPAYLPGQYVSLQVKPPGLAYFQSRQYSLSAAPREEGDYYRVSVKKEEGREGASPPGVVSNLLHDELQEGAEVGLSHPQGEFFVDPKDGSKRDVPLVLISAGVGATPMMGILDAVAGKGRPISWIQAAMEEKKIPFVEQVRKVAEENKDTVRASVFLELGGKAGSYKGFATGYEGRIVLENLDGAKDLFVQDGRTEYCVCGPEEWMIAIRKGLVDMGVGQERIALELFDTGDVADDA